VLQTCLEQLLELQRKALTTSTLKYGLQIANKGLEKAAKENSEIAKGVK